MISYCVRNGILFSTAVVLIVSSSLQVEGRKVQSPPYFTSVPTIVRARENDTAKLPCHVENLGGFTVRWLRDGSSLAERTALDEYPQRSSVMPRAMLHPDNALEVHELGHDDSGVYECNVIRPAPWPPLRQKHAIEVLMPAEVSLVPNDTVITVQVGDQVTLECLTRGVPTPILAWTAMGGGELREALPEEELQLLRRRPHLQFEVNSRRAAGAYRCEATNDVGSPAAAELSVVVQHSPEVRAEKQWIHTAPSNRAELACWVIAEPTARVKWYREKAQGDTVELSEVQFSGRVVRPHVQSDADGHERYALLFRSVKEHDLGSYTCRAHNLIGNSSATILLSGVAKPAVIKSDPNMATQDSFSLIWQVDSYSPLYEYLLKFRKHGAREWYNLTIPASSEDGDATSLHSHTYDLQGLQSFTQYEVELLSRNKFGWSASSDNFSFTTLGPGETPVEKKNVEVEEQSPPEPKIVSIAGIGQRSAKTSNAVALSPNLFTKPIICLLIFLLI